MPIYEYQCSKCGKRSEIMVGIGSQSDAVECKYCGSAKINKLPTYASVATSYSRPKGRTCCGRDERCDKPPCSNAGACGRD
jgi:putative FmdB family regulatory protein